MPLQSLRDYLQAVEAHGDLLQIDGADREEEIGALAEIVASTPGHPLVLFDKIKGFPTGFRVSASTMGGIRRMALGLGLDPALSNIDLVRSWKEKLKTFKPVPMKEVHSGPILENVIAHKDVDLLSFPAPKWHEHDGGYYIGTGCCVFLREPDENWVNMGVYRVMVHDATTLGIFINHIQHGKQILQKYWARRQNCPITVSFGQAPSLYLAAAQREPWGVSELSVAGWLAGSPVEIVRGEVTGLPIPAHAEIRGFFDTLDHGWLVKFIEHRVVDRRVVWLIQKWLKAGVLEDGKRIKSEVGTVQGGSISPLLANIYLHYVFDLWVQQWRLRKARGEVVVVRFADDLVVGFEHREDGERFLSELRERLVRFGLELHAQKTRLIEFGRHAEKDRQSRGEGKPETFNFLGFTHSCAKTRRGRFTVLRQTMRRRWQAKLREIRAELCRRMHEPVPEMGVYVRAVLLGHMHYYGVPMNAVSVSHFRMAMGRIWWRVLKRRSQKNHLPWTRMERQVARWLPHTHICHPYPWVRFGVIT